MTGFRVHLQGAQGLYGVTPDLTTLGKVIGGGMPVGAFGGKRAIMEKIAPLGPVYQAGTLSGNPVAVAAGLATLHAIQAPGFYDRLGERTRALTEGLTAVAAKPSASTSKMTTLTPSSRNRFAQALPMPRAAPVMAATLPDSFMGLTPG